MPEGVWTDEMPDGLYGRYQAEEEAKEAASNAREGRIIMIRDKIIG